MSKTLSALTSATTPLAGTEELYVVQGGNSRMTTAAAFYIPGGTDVAVADGGTGLSSYTTGDILYASGATTLTKFATTAYGRSLLALANSTALSGELSTFYQPLDADLTAIAALSTTTYGRSLLTKTAAEDVRTSLATAPYVATRAALKALDTSKDTVAYLTEAGREGIFAWNSADLSSILTIDTLTTTAVNSGTGVLTKAAHGYLTGETLIPSASVNGLTAGTKYYAIRSNGSEDNFKLASSWANAMAGTAVTLTGTTNVTLVRLLDPAEGVYVVKTGGDPGGANGAWVRKADRLTADLWGVKRDGSTDDTQAMNAAALYTSQKGETLRLLPGTYLINTNSDSSYSARALGKISITLRGRDGWKILGTDGVIFQQGTTGNYSHVFFIMDCHEWEFGHVKFVGDNTGLSAGNNNGALAPYSCRDFHVHDVTTSVFQGSHIVGNFWINADFDRIHQNIPSSASGFDCASIQNVTVNRQTVVGAGTGSGQGFQHSYDVPNANPAFNTTGVSIYGDVSNNFRVTNGDYSACATGIAILAGTGFWIEGNNIHDNYIASGDSIYGAVIGAPAGQDIWGAKVIGNRFQRNGSASGTAGVRGGLSVNSNLAAVHAEIRGNQFYDNAPAGIAVFGSASTISGLEDNDFGNVSGSAQTLDWSGSPLAVAKVLDVDDALTSATSVGLRVRHKTSGTAAANSGVAIDLEAQTAGGNVRKGGRITARVTTATDGAEAFSLDFGYMTGGTLLEGIMRLLSNGLLRVGSTTLGTGVDYGINWQSSFPQSWQMNCSAANGNLYLFDQTSSKFPLAIGPALPDNALSLLTTGISSTLGFTSKHSTQGIGYATGAGGTVTQLTSRTTGVTLNKASGAITMFSAAGSATAATFTVTNSAVASTDTISLNQKSGTNLYNFIVTAVGAGSFNVTFYTTGGTATDAPVINFNVIKGVTS